jgi:4-amino-4-deoxy-L-arabinose transferase-like glycosyltransferase
MPSSFGRKTTLVVLLTILVRFAFVVAVSSGRLRPEHNPDAEDYLSFAHNLATGVGFAHAVNEDQPFSKPVEFSAWRAPLYPMFLAAAFQLSRATWFLRLLQVMLSAFSVYFLMRVGVVLFGELPALIAGIAYAIYPPLIFFSADLGTESLFLFLVLAVFFVFYQDKERSPLRVFGLGVLAGLSTLCRPNGVALFPALALAIWFAIPNRAQATRRIVLLGLAMAMVVLPWTYRNYRLYHKFVLVSTNGGATLWAAAHLRLEPGASLQEVGYSQHKAFRDVPEPDRERYYYRQAFAVLDHSPLRFAKMFLANFCAMYTLVPAATYHSLSNRVVYSLTYIPLLVTGVGGWLLVLRRWRELSLLWGWVLATSVLYCTFLTSIRYRVATIDPILMLGTGICIAALIGRRSQSATSTVPG